MTAPPMRRPGAQAPGAGSEDALARLARRVVALAIGVGFPVVVAVWVTEAGSDPVVRWGYPPLLALLVGLGWALVRRPDLARPVAYGSLAVLQAAWLVGFVVRIRSGPDVDDAWTSLFPTSFLGVVVFLVVGFLYLPTRVALVHGAVYVCLVAGVVSGALVTVPGGTEYLGDLLRYVVYLGVLLVLLLVLARAKERLALAEHEARRAGADASRMRDIAYLDELTGIANRRRLVEELRHQADLVAPGHPVAVVFFDLDRFKSVNDALGHAAGDRVLQLVARAASAVVREGDLLARLGGEEFVVVAPATGPTDAVHLAHRIRSAIPEAVEAVSGPRVTASFGVTALGAGEDPDTVLRRVDALMYAAKQSGRDRVQS